MERLFPIGGLFQTATLVFLAVRAGDPFSPVLEFLQWFAKWIMVITAGRSVEGVIYEAYYIFRLAYEHEFW